MQNGKDKKKGIKAGGSLIEEFRIQNAELKDKKIKTGGWKAGGVSKEKVPRSQGFQGSRGKD